MKPKIWIPVLGWTLLLAGCSEDDDGLIDPVPGSIDININPTGATLIAGTNGTAEITIARTDFTGPVALSVSATPTGITATVAPPTTTGNTATMTVATTAAAAGTHVLMVRAIASGPTGELRDSVAFALAIQPVPVASIDVTVTPASLTLDAGSSGTVNVGIVRSNLTANVLLSVSAPPQNITATLSPTSTTGNTSTLSLTTTAAAAVGNHAFMIRATASGPIGELRDSVAFTLTVRAVVTGGRWSQLAAGVTHTCGVTPQSVAYCWGEGGVGNLGNGTTTARTTPTAVSGGHAFRPSLSAGSDHVCGVTTGGVGYCWGGGNLGQLGHGLNAHSTTPILVMGGLSYTSISAGNGFSCGIVSNAGHCWGDGLSGQLGTGTTASRNTPGVAVGGLALASVSLPKRQGALGPGFSCGLTTAGAPYCWGTGASGELGNGGTAPTSVPVAVSGGLTFTSLSAGGNHVCAVTTAGAAYCWGEGDNGRLGNGATQDRSTPAAVSGGLTFTAIAAGLAHTCALTTAGAAYCWGEGEFGRLGNGTTNGSLVPVAVVGGNAFVTVTAGGYHSCAVTSGAAAFCWGHGGDGRLGYGGTLQSSTPVRVIDP